MAHQVRGGARWCASSHSTVGRSSLTTHDHHDIRTLFFLIDKTPFEILRLPIYPLRSTNEFDNVIIRNGVPYRDACA